MQAYQTSRPRGVEVRVTTVNDARAIVSLMLKKSYDITTFFFLSDIYLDSDSR